MRVVSGEFERTIGECRARKGECLVSTSNRRVASLQKCVSNRKGEWRKSASGVYRVRKGEYRVSSSKKRVAIVEFKKTSVEFEKVSSECEVRKSECRVRKGEFEKASVEYLLRTGGGEFGKASGE